MQSDRNVGITYDVVNYRGRGAAAADDDMGSHEFAYMAVDSTYVCLFELYL